MFRLTFFRNCILNNSYDEVIHHSYMQTYIDTLQHITINTNQQIYLKKKGSFEIDLNDDDNYVFNPNNLNYLDGFNYLAMIDEQNNLQYYYFIDNFEIFNGVIYFEYSIDYWSTYSNKIKFRKSLLSNNLHEIEFRTMEYLVNQRYLDTIKYLPINYSSNNLPILHKYQDNFNYINVMLIQKYKLNQGGQITSRISYLCIETNSSGTPIEYTTIGKFEKNTTAIKIQSSDAQQNFAYDIVACYCLPKYLINNDFITYLQNNGGSVENFLGTYFLTIETTNVNGDITIFNTTIENLFNIQVGFNTNGKLLEQAKYTHFGLYSNLIELDKNGTSTPIKISLHFSLCSFNIVVELQNKIYDISSNFIFNIPVNITSATDTQQQRTAIELGNVSMKLNKIGAIGNIATSSVQLFGGIESGGYSQTSQKMLYGGSSGLINGVNSLYQNELKQKQLNQKSYASNTSSNASNNLANDLLYGLILIEINPDNEDIVKTSLNELGFEINHIINDELILEFNNPNASYQYQPSNYYDYNVIKFSSVNIYGLLAQNELNVIKDILIKGCKIWYNNVV